MDQARQYFQQNSSMISTVVFIVLALLVVYIVYTYLYPSDDPSYVQFLDREKDARKSPIALKKNGKAPAIFTGGDFTLSFWIYVDDWNYRVASYKPLFNLGPMATSSQNRSVLVGMLTPMQNGLMIRGATTGSTNSNQGPDITMPDARTQVLNGQTSQSMFSSTVDSPCDIKEVPLQRWVCVTIVSSGRVLDVYMNGKLSRSCVLDSILQVPMGDIYLSLGSFGGRYASVQMWNVQLTPDVIYGVYQMGPTQTKRSIFTDFAKYFNLNVSFTGSSPGGSLPGFSNPFCCNSAPHAGSCGAAGLTPAAGSGGLAPIGK